jgi:hypothetical protein
VHPNQWSERLVSCREAYRIVFEFLDDIFEKGGRWDDLAGLVSSMAIYGDQIPSDQAILIDWAQSCDHVLNSYESGSLLKALREVQGRNFTEEDWPVYSLTGAEAYAATRQFLQDMHELGWQLTDAVLAKMPISADTAQQESDLFNDWIAAFHRVII